DQVREVMQQAMVGGSSREGVSVHGLEQVHGMVADIARFEYRGLAQLTLKAEAPGVHLVRSKIRSDNSLVLGARIEGIGRNRGSQRSPHVRAGRQCRRIGQTSSECLQEPEG